MVNLLIVVLWVMSMCSVVSDYQCFEVTCCLHLQDSKDGWYVALKHW
jgi:hypothetical protein